MDGLLGYVVWLQATGRAFLAATPMSERLAEHEQELQGILVRTRGLGVLRNGMMRDAGLRRKVDDYWVKEGEIMRHTMEDPKVLEAQRLALSRVGVDQYGRGAEKVIDTILGESNDVPPEGGGG